MNLHTLTAISPVDGRYYKQVKHLSAWFSEYALMKYRLHVEVEYFILLSEEGYFTMHGNIADQMRFMVEHFSEADAAEVKKTEAITNHDVKAVEYFIKEKLGAAGADDIKEWVHFGLTSQDINNTAIPLSWKESVETRISAVAMSAATTLTSLAKNGKTCRCWHVHMARRLLLPGLAKS